MKRKLFLGAFTIAIVCVGAVGASNYSATSAENDLDMANVEALSQLEPGIFIPCNTQEYQTCSINVRFSDGTGGVQKFDNKIKAAPYL